MAEKSYALFQRTFSWLTNGVFSFILLAWILSVPSFFRAIEFETRLLFLMSTESFWERTKHRKGKKRSNIRVTRKKNFCDRWVSNLIACFSYLGWHYWSSRASSWSSWCNVYFNKAVWKRKVFVWTNVINFDFFILPIEIGRVLAIYDFTTGL